MVFAGGQLKLPGAKDPCDKHKKWSIVAGALGAATYISNELVSDNFKSLVQLFITNPSYFKYLSCLWLIGYFIKCL